MFITNYRADEHKIIDDNDNEVLMTKDHIIPKSKGGKNNLSNYQPMCCICNKQKDNNIIRKEMK